VYCCKQTNKKLQENTSKLNSAACQKFYTLWPSGISPRNQEFQHTKTNPHNAPLLQNKGGTTHTHTHISIDSEKTWQMQHLFITAINKFGIEGNLALILPSVVK
jgi:hypothetical protein